MSAESKDTGKDKEVTEADKDEAEAILETIITPAQQLEIAKKAQAQAKPTAPAASSSSSSSSAIQPASGKKAGKVKDGSHAFWDTQPMPKIDSKIAEDVNEPFEADKPVDQVKQDP
eukprot:TRINITY_DN8675_c3_g1_i1.p1 TRINITY_DN8675_c3_g1~~TRINITY_DN8675_c3_g1_i1.p1  ORF type:complete len:116 (+),score=44.41 TRINITY_DN8675_c3_g1_i1:52-399(+)